MSDVRVIPVFSDVQNRPAAEALSEPFIRPEDFSVQVRRSDPLPNLLDSDNLVAIGTSYVGDSGQAEFEFAMHPLTPAPYAAAQAFVEGYDQRITRYQVTAGQMIAQLGALGEDGLKYWERKAIEYAGKADLRTMGAYAVFSFEETQYAGGIIAASSIVFDSPLEGRDVQMGLERNDPDLSELYSSLIGLAAGASKEDVDQARQDIAHNRSQERFGLVDAPLPPVQALRRLVDDHPAVDGFLSLPRKQRRALLRAEQKR